MVSMTKKARKMNLYIAGIMLVGLVGVAALGFIARDNVSPLPGGVANDPATTTQTNGGDTVSTPPDDGGQASGPVVGKGCVVGGCSSQLCGEAGDDLISTCEWREEYACYQDAICERQANGECGWTETNKLTQCIDSANTGEGGVY